MQSIQKLIVFLYTNSKLSEKETKKKLHLQLHQKITRNKFNQGYKTPLLGKL